MSAAPLLPELPDDAPAWVFVADRPLARSEVDTLEARVARALDGWSSHGRPVSGGYAVIYDRILVAAATLDGDISGCGIDKLTHAAEGAAIAIGFKWLTGLSMLYRNGDGEVHVATRAALRRGTVPDAQQVVWASPHNLGDLRQNGLFRSLSLLHHPVTTSA
ncbi:hypothetical protein BH23BAC4_BH23BAC4_09110 [soil metagenome]